MITADGQQIGGKIASVQDDKLTLATTEPRTFDLADLESITFGDAPATPAASSGDLVWIGQDNHDLVQVGGASGGNGIQDIHLRADALSGKPLKQIVVLCRFPKMLRVWRLDTSQSPHWRLAVERSATDRKADLYLEPAADDSFGMKFEATFTYDDGSTTKATVSGTTHTSDKQKLDSGAKPGQASGAQPAAAASGNCEVFLNDQGRLQGNVLRLSGEVIVLETSWKAEVEVPLLHVRGVWFGNSGPSGARAEFDKQLTAPVADDAILLTAPDKSLAQIAGDVLGLADDRLQVRYEGEERSIKRERLLGLVFAAHARALPFAGVYQSFLLAQGQSFAGRWVGVQGAELEIEMPWQARWRLPASAVGQARIRNGRLVSLADMEPVSVEETSYFSRVVPWQREQGFDGAPPAMKGKQPLRALAVHSRCVLHYALDEQFEKFRTTVGFDDSSQGRGRVVCRVMADGRELFAQADLRADQDPVAVDVDVKGAKQLTLEVDFGENEDIGDRVLWTEPRLFRAAGN